MPDASGIGRRTLVAGTIRLAGLGLSLAFILVIARATDAEQFGVFSLLLSLATILGYGANLGQHVAILRFWPAVEDRHGKAQADRLLGICFGLVALGAAVVGSALAAPALFGVADGTNLFWAGALAMMLALAEFCASALRAKGHIVFAMGPRDIVWRVLVVLAVLLWPHQLIAEQGLAITALALALAIVPQISALLADIRESRDAPCRPAKSVRSLRRRQRSGSVRASTRSSNM